MCKKQYVGQTTDKFRLRWNNYKSCQKKAKSNRAHTQILFHSHFLGEKHNGLVSNCDIVIIDKTNPASRIPPTYSKGSDPSILKNRLENRFPETCLFLARVVDSTLFRGYVD